MLAMTLFLRLLDEASGFNKSFASKISVIGTMSIETENTVADKYNLIYTNLVLYLSSRNRLPIFYFHRELLRVYLDLVDVDPL